MPLPPILVPISGNQIQGFVRAGQELCWNPVPSLAFSQCFLETVRPPVQEWAVVQALQIIHEVIRLVLFLYYFKSEVRIKSDWVRHIDKNSSWVKLFS